MIALPAIPKPLVWIVAALALLAALTAGFNAIYGNGYDAGQAAERLAAKEALDARQREDQRLANQLAATARAEATGWRDNAQRLQIEVRRAHQLAVACAAPVAAAGSAAGGDAAGAASGVDAGLPGGSGWRLSADAVRLWNSALAGRPVPAGACGADGTPAGACAAATDAQLEDVWANHTENAARCGIDRANHKRLIEFLQARQGAAVNQ